MNKIYRLGLAAGLFGCVALGNAQTYRDRDSDGLIEIYNIEQLDSIRYNLTGTCSGSTCNGYELTRNLDFNVASSYRDTTGRFASFTKRTGNGWNPIGTSSAVAFNTTLEGNRYTIDHLFINRSTTDYVGLVGYAESSSRIRNIGLRNVSVRGNNRVGGLVGINYYGTISQSYATGAVMGNNSVGGLVGENHGTISQSYATGSVTGNHSVGGLVGTNRLGTISQSYATGSVTGVTGSNSPGGLVGGLVGYNDSGTISQSYATGAVSGTSNVGGLVGHNNRDGTIRHGYWNVDAPQTVNGTARSKNTQVGIDANTGTSSYIRDLTLVALQSPTGTVSDSIQELGPGFIYRQGRLPRIDSAVARITVNTINFTETTTTLRSIGTNSTVANVMQGTSTTRATLTIDGIHFTANLIGTTSINSPYTLTNIQNGVGGKTTQTITFSAPPQKTFGDAPFVLSATSSAGLSVSFSASNTLVSINNNTVTIRGTGTVSITAYNTGNDTYLGTSASQPLFIIDANNPNKTNPTLTFTAIPNLSIGQKYVLMATSHSPVTIIFTSSDTNKVSIKGNTATAKAVGNVIITANQASNDQYNAATTSQNVTVIDPTIPIPTLTFAAIPNLTIGEKYTLMATSNSPVTIIFTSSDTNKVSIKGNTATAKAIGSVIITARQEANAEFNAAIALQSVGIIQVTKTNPTLTFSAVLNLTVGQKYVMTATSNSAAAISFTSSDVRIATVLGNTLTAVAVGTVTITASQQANTQFNAASATRVVTIIAAPSVVIILDNNTIFEKLPPGSQIGILYASGLTNASFSTAHPSFRINGNALISNAEFNFLEGPRAYSLIISASGTNGTVSQVFFIETIRQVPYEQTLLSGVYVVGKDQTNYRIITLPYTNQTTAVFDALGGFDKTKWRLFDWNNGAYNEINTTTSLERGRGYFFLTSRDASMHLNPNGNTFTGSHLFNIPVTQGWNLLGNPYPFAMNWNAVSVSINGNKPTNVLIYDGAFQASTAVDIYQGFFVYMPSAGIVSIPLQAGFSFGMNAPSSQTARMSSNANNWQVQFTLANEQTTYTLSALGMSEGAEKGYDAEDLPTVPHFINKASIDFPHSEHFMKSFTKDIQPLSDNTTWDFIAEQSGYRVDFTLSWKIENIPQNELFLLDTKKGRFINMKEKNTYTLDLSSARAFRVYYGEKSFIESAYSNISPNVFDIYPNPTSDKISIPFFTPEEGYSLTLQVFDIHGKHVFSTIHNSSTKGNQTFHVETEKYMSHQGTYFSKMILEKGNTKKEVSQKIVKNEK